jgi:2-amino-4-hydroxy-6-hydroxymethyldihydropteridine diphosphokinase
VTAPEPAAAPRRVILALGSNLGDRAANLQGAVGAIADASGLTLVAISPVYETGPVGGPPQPDYLNAVLIVRSALPAKAILDLAHGIEKAFHRSREIPMGPRTLDIDLIACGDEVSADPGLTLPHPRAHERAFVLVPWLEADPDAELPGRGRVAGILAGLTGARVTRCRDTVLIKPQARKQTPATPCPE